MRWSTVLIPTLREDAALLVRAGYLRQGYLFLGVRALQKIAGIVRGELAAIGAQEVLLTDAVRLARNELRSYRQLPQIWFQIAGGTKIEVSWFGAADETIRAACERVLARCGLDNVADFTLPLAGGEDCLVRCPKCGYASAFETASARASQPLAPDPEGDRDPEAFPTPGRKTIADVAEFTGLPASTQMKSLVLVADDRPVLALVRGDHQLSEAKFACAVGADSMRPARPEEIQEWFGAGAGSLGPVGVKNLRVIADEALRGRRNMIAGANRDDYHLRHVTPGEDFQPEYFEIRLVAPGDACLSCGAAIAFEPALALGHFRRSGCRGLHVTNESSQEVPLPMGSATFDPERVLRAAAEVFRDNDGLALPRSIAPFDVIVTPVNIRDAAQREAAESLEAESRRAGLDALFDDRDERPGVKFKDADLIGVPWRITVGKKLAQGMVEVVERRTKAVHEVAPAEALSFVKAQLQ
jgi:prolyl-tRNA synthetase